MISQEKLKDLLEYDLETGLWRWRQEAGTRKRGWFPGHPHNAGYYRLRIQYESYLAHRLAWLYVYGVWPLEIDHINRIRTDNRISNLREVNSSQNKFNSSYYYSNSGHRGVYFDIEKSNYRAQIKFKGVHYRKRFATLEQAIEWRNQKELELYGENRDTQPRV